MENLLDVSKGLHLDYNPISQPQGTYTYLLNAIRIGSGAIENERGSLIVHDFVTKHILQGCVLDQDLILFLYPSEIGVLDKNDVYTSITTNKDLNFELDSKIDATAKKYFNGNRLVYFVDGVNTDRYINLDSTTLQTSLTFKDDIKLEVIPETPLVQIDGVSDGGNLLTGVYEFTARLLTKSTNAAPFGLLSPLVSIIDESDSSSFIEKDGALPQSVSPKSIQLTIANIDASYSYLEVAVVTYTGQANIATSYLLEKIPIDGRTSVSFSYSSAEQHVKSVDLSNITIKPVSYDHSKSIEQKDGVVVRSNLSATENSYNFQSAINLIKLKYFIEEIPWQQGYKDPLVSALKKGYRRGEVYSFAATPNFGTSYNTTSYHIAAPVIRVGGLLGKYVPANVVTKDLGAYLSDEKYPLDKNYPNTDSDNVRHFIMPTMQQEPIFVKRNNQIYIRIVGVEVDFTDCIALVPTAVKKNLKGFNLVRQIRTDNNKSILTQGIAQIHGSHNEINQLMLVPASGATIIGNREGGMKNQNFYPKQVGFYSPESVIYEKSFLLANKIQPLIKLTGTQTIVTESRDGGNRRVYSFLDYDNLVKFTDQPSTRTILSNTAQYIPASSGENIGNPITLVGPTNGSVTSWKNNGYLYLGLDNDLPINQDIFAAGYPEFRYDDIIDRADLLYLNGQQYSDTNKSTTSTRYLYNLVRPLPNQYGSVYGASYMYCGTYQIKEDGIIKQFFGGDTFIGKFGVMSTTAGVTSVSTLGAVKLPYSVDFKTLNYFFVESEINIDLRHYTLGTGKEGDVGFVPSTVPYYPKYQKLWEPEATSGQIAGTPGLFNLGSILGHPRGYNKQYSFENTLIKYSPKLLEEELVTNYENRSIYSEQSGEGEQLDANRIFLPNNYHDIPKDRGPIVDTFVHNNKFFHHTTGALYESFFNEKVTQASSIGEVYLGTGGVFNRPSEPIERVAGGYAGTQGKWGIETPFGYFFIDARQKKCFVLGSKLEDLSGQGLDLFFAEIEEDHKFCLVYDYVWDRLLLTSSNGWTLSYQKDFKSWTGFHSYLPYVMISRGKEVYFGIGNGIHKLGIGPHTTYNSQYEPMVLEYVANVEAKTTKSFDNLVIHSTSYAFNLSSEIKSFKPYNTFSQIRVYNEVKDTSTIDLVIPRNFDEEWQVLGVQQIFAKYKSLEYRLAIPKDLLEDPLVPEVYVTNKDFRPQMTGKWAKIRLTYATPETNFVLHTIETKIGGVPR